MIRRPRVVGSSVVVVVGVVVGGDVGVVLSVVAGNTILKVAFFTEYCLKTTYHH